MKKIINDPSQIIDEMANGIVRENADRLDRVAGTSVVVQKEIGDQVALVSGGGSGHEPAHAGFVGQGMLQAAVCGQVFTSPTSDQVLEAIKAADQGKGVLLIIKNYSGDVMNFEMAMELAEMEDIQVEKIIVDDDIAVEDSSDTQGKRGVAGTVLLHKLLGAAAINGASLTELKELGDKAVANINTLGVALTGATVPEVGKPGFVLDENEIEFGVGIHGEPGLQKTELKPSAEIAQEIVGHLKEAFSWSAEDKYGVLVNGLGGTPLMEQYIFLNDILGLLDQNDLQLPFIKVGNLMTSLEMQGVSLTLIKLEDNWLDLLQEDTQAAAWWGEKMFSKDNVVESLEIFTNKIHDQRGYLSELDTPIGDGDHGNNMNRGATALKQELSNKEADNLADVFKVAALTFMSKIGGASGPLYGSAFLEMSKAAQDASDPESILSAGLSGIQKRGKAEVGDKTMVDLWSGALDLIKEGQLTYQKLDQIVEKTKEMKAHKGRASYLGDRSIGHIDPGAMSSKYLFEAFIKGGVFD